MKQPRATWSSAVFGLTLLGLGVGMTTYAAASGEGARTKPPDARAFPAGSDARARSVGYAPDPTPLREANQFVVTLRYEQGKVRLVSARKVSLRRPVATPRRVGRFAFEMLSGPTVVERLRFDFPLIGAHESAVAPRSFNDPPRFETKATVTYRVMVPDSPRIARARLVDRATGASMMLPWPPDMPFATGEADSGTRDASRGGPRDARLPKDGGPHREDGKRPDAWRVPDAPSAPDIGPPRPMRPEHGERGTQRQP